MASELYKGYLTNLRCDGDLDELWAIAEKIYVRQRSILFKVIRFRLWHIPVFEWIHISRRVAWGFSEVFIVLLAMNLSMKFKHFNQRLLRTRHGILWKSYWKETYEHYVQLCSLVEKADDFVSPILLVIIFADFFFLLEQLYQQYE